MGIVVGELSVEIGANTRSFSNDLNGIKRTGDSFASSFSSGINTTIGGAFGNLGTIGTAAFQTISSVASSVISGMQKIGTVMTNNVTLPIAAGATAVLTLGKNFESELSKVTGLVGVSKSQVDSWGKEILDLAPELGRAPQELAEALFFVTSAGLRGAAAMDVLEMSGKAASAGLGETKTIADLVTSAMNAYGVENLSAGQATDILTAAVREGKAEASELASSMGQVLPIASEMGVSFDQVAAAQAAMTKTGTSASESSTQLKSILSGLLKPSEQAEDALKGMGTSSAELRKSIKEKGLISTLGDLRTLTNKYGEDAMAKVFPNIRALSGVLDLMGANAEDNVEVFDAVKNSTGSLDEAFKAASETLDFKWNQALSQVQATALSFFEILKATALPILEKLVAVLQWVSDKFSALSPQMQQFFVIFGVAAAAIGPIILLITTAITTLVTTIGTLITAGAAAYGMFVVLGPVIAILGTIITSIIAIVTALVASFVHLWKTNDKFKEEVIKTWNIIKEHAISIFNSLKEIVKIALNAIKGFWKTHGDSIMSIVKSAWSLIMSIIRNGARTIDSIVKLVLNVIKGDWSAAWGNIKTILQSAWNVIKSIFRTSSNVALQLMISLVKGIINKFKQIPSRIKAQGNAVKSAFAYGIKLAISYLNSQLNVFKSAGAKLGKMVADGIKSAISACAGAAKTLAGTVRNYLPFSPAKTGPLSDLDKLDFYSSIKKSLNAAKAKISVPVEAVASEISDNLLGNVSMDTLKGTNDATMKKWYMPISIYGIQNSYDMMKELKATLRRYSGRM